MAKTITIRTDSTEDADYLIYLLHKINTEEDLAFPIEVLVREGK